MKRSQPRRQRPGSKAAKMSRRDGLRISAFTVSIVSGQSDDFDVYGTAQQTIIGIDIREKQAGNSGKGLQACTEKK